MRYGYIPVSQCFLFQSLHYHPDFLPDLSCASADRDNITDPSCTIFSTLMMGLFGIALGLLNGGVCWFYFEFSREFSSSRLNGFNMAPIAAVLTLGPIVASIITGLLVQKVRNYGIHKCITTKDYT